MGDGHTNDDSEIKKMLILLASGGRQLHRLLTHPKFVSSNKATEQIEQPSEFTLIYPIVFFLQTFDTFSLKKNRLKLTSLDIYL